MTDLQKRDKDDSFWKILNAALELDCKKGHLKWTLSDLSRKSKITRSLIYYYFGRSKVSILQEAVKLIGEDLVGLKQQRIAMWQKGDLLNSMKEVRQLRSRAPYICQFILEHRDQDNEVGLEIRRMELEFFAKIQSFFPQASKSECEGIIATYWGLTFIPEISDAGLVAVLEIILQRMKVSAAKTSEVELESGSRSF